MITVNYDRQSGDFSFTVKDNLSGEAIELLERISQAKGSFTNDTLVAERELLQDEGKEKESDNIMSQIHMISSLEDYHLIEKYPINEKGVLIDFGYELTHVGKVVLNIRHKKC